MELFLRHVCFLMVALWQQRKFRSRMTSKALLRWDLGIFLVRSLEVGLTFPRKSSLWEILEAVSILWSAWRHLLLKPVYGLVSFSVPPLFPPTLHPFSPLPDLHGVLWCWITFRHHARQQQGSYWASSCLHHEAKSQGPDLSPRAEQSLLSLSVSCKHWDTAFSFFFFKWLLLNRLDSSWYQGWKHSVNWEGCR